MRQYHADLKVFVIKNMWIHKRIYVYIEIRERDLALERVKQQEGTKMSLTIPKPRKREREKKVREEMYRMNDEHKLHFLKEMLFVGSSSPLSTCPSRLAPFIFFTSRNCSDLHQPVQGSQNLSFYAVYEDFILMLLL